MTPNKKLEKGSRYEAHDLDGDGIVTDEEIAREKERVELLAYWAEPKVSVAQFFRVFASHEVYVF